MQESCSLLKPKIKPENKNNHHHNQVLRRGGHMPFPLHFFLLSTFFRVTLVFLEQRPILNRFIEHFESKLRMFYFTILTNYFENDLKSNLDNSKEIK